MAFLRALVKDPSKHAKKKNKKVLLDSWEYRTNGICSVSNRLGDHSLVWENQTTYTPNISNGAWPRPGMFETEGSMIVALHTAAAVVRKEEGHEKSVCVDDALPNRADRWCFWWQLQVEIDGSREYQSCKASKVLILS